MPRTSKKTEATTASEAINVILDTPVLKTVSEAANFVGCAEIRLLELFSDALNLPEALGWEVIPQEHEHLLNEFKAQASANTQVLPETVQPPVGVTETPSQAPSEPPVLEEEPQPAGKMTRSKRQSSQLTDKRKQSIDKTSKTSKKLGAGLDEAELLVEAQKGRKKGAKKAAVRLVAEEETYNEVLTKAAIQRLADAVGETEEEEDFDPLAYVRQAGSQDLDQTLKTAMEKITPVLGKLQDASDEIVDNSYSNGSTLDLSRLQKLMQSTN